MPRGRHERSRASARNESPDTAADRDQGHHWSEESARSPNNHQVAHGVAQALGRLTSRPLLTTTLRFAARDHRYCDVSRMLASRSGRQKGRARNVKQKSDRPSNASPTRLLLRECELSRVSPFELAPCFWAVTRAPVADVVVAVTRVRRQRVRIGGPPIASAARPWQEPARHRALTCASTRDLGRVLAGRRHSTIRCSTASFPARPRPRPLCCADNDQQLRHDGRLDRPEHRAPRTLPIGDTNPNAGRCTM